MNSRVELGRWWAERDGDQISAGWGSRARLVFYLTDDGGLELDAGFADVIRTIEEHRQGWWDWWEGVTQDERDEVLASTVYRTLRCPVPPLTVRTDDARWAYLQRIAENEIKVSGVGEVRLTMLRSWLDQQGIGVDAGLPRYEENGE